MIIKRIRNFFRRLFGKSSVSLTEQFELAGYKLWIERLAIESAINLVAGLMAKVPVKTFAKHKEVKKDDWYLLNIAPNPNQTANQFFAQVISQLIRHNECLIIPFNNQLYVADDFIREQYALYPDVFKNILIKDLVLQKNYTAEEAIYLTFADENITVLLQTVLNDYNEFLSLAADKYKRSGGRKGVVFSGIEPQQSESWNNAIDDLYGDKFKKYFENENGLVVIPEGMDYKEFSNPGDSSRTSVITDITTLTDQVYKMVATAFRLSPSLLRGEVQDTGKAIEQTLTFLIDPLVNSLEEGFNKTYYGRRAYQAGFYCKFDTTTIKHIDLFDVADKVDKYIADGVYSIDGMREKLGDTPIGADWSQKHYITKNYADAQLTNTDSNGESEGGENDGKTDGKTENE